jgi:hypothetical protein
MGVLNEKKCNIMNDMRHPPEIKEQIILTFLQDPLTQQRFQKIKKKD